MEQVHLREYWFKLTLRTRLLFQTDKLHLDVPQSIEGARNAEHMLKELEVEKEKVNSRIEKKKS